LVIRIMMRPAGAESVFGTKASSDADAWTLSTVVAAVEPPVVVPPDVVVVECVPVWVVAPPPDVVADDVEVTGVLWVVVPELLDPPQPATAGTIAAIATTHNAPLRRTRWRPCMGSPLLFADTARARPNGAAPIH
jgi:hypothetical protein